MPASTTTSRISLFFLAFFAIGVGIYPVLFLFLIPEGEGLLSSKSPELLQSSVYMGGFYTHILLGGLALLSGFSQFFPKLRQKRLGLHRVLGKIYVVAVVFSGGAGLAIAFFATGGVIPAMGFALLALLWLFTTFKAYSSIKKRTIDAHQRWMIRSYALCFAAVTLRIYLPLFQGVLEMEFINAYRIIAWLCWVPNLIIAEFYFVRRLPHKAGFFS